MHVIEQVIDVIIKSAKSWRSLMFASQLTKSPKQNLAPNRKSSAEGGLPAVRRQLRVPARLACPARPWGSSGLLTRRGCCASRRRSQHKYPFPGSPIALPEQYASIFVAPLRASTCARHLLRPDGERHRCAVHGDVQLRLRWILRRWQPWRGVC